MAFIFALSTMFFLTKGVAGLSVHFEYHPKKKKTMNNFYIKILCGTCMPSNLFTSSSSCQFVVSASGDYSIHSGDPDRLVDWDKIEQVVSVHLLSSRTCLQNCCTLGRARICFHDWRVCVCVCDLALPFRGYSVIKFLPVRYVSIHQEQVS